MQINKFKIVGLHGRLNFELVFNDNKLILVAENGKGKTTLLAIVYLTLTQQWNHLSKYKFTSILVTIDDSEYLINKSSLSQTKFSTSRIDKLKSKYPLYETFINEIFSTVNLSELSSNPHLISTLEEKSDVPRSLILTMIDYLSQESTELPDLDWEFKTVYLPTYRRIEKSFYDLFTDLDDRSENYVLSRFPGLKGILGNEGRDDLKKIFSSIWQEKDIDSWKRHGSHHYTELVEFGMDDVQYKVSSYMAGNKESLNKIKSLIDTCNNYMADGKKLALNEDKNSLVVTLADGSKLGVDSLSSGEKQIISIFCHLMLEDQQTFIIIDEPEISLALSWQERFLRDVIESNNGGFLVATHSPYIVADELQDFTAGLNEFAYS